MSNRIGNSFNRDYLVSEDRRRKQVRTMQKQHQAQIDNNKRSSEDRVKRLKDHYEKEKSSIVNTFQSQIAASKADVEKDIVNFHKKHSEELATIAEKNEREKRVLARRFKERLEDIKASYEAIIEDKDSKIADMQYQHEAKLKRLYQERMEQVQEIKDNLKERVSQLRNSYEKDIQDTLNQMRSKRV